MLDWLARNHSKHFLIACWSSGAATFEESFSISIFFIQLSSTSWAQLLSSLKKKELFFLVNNWTLTNCPVYYQSSYLNSIIPIRETVAGEACSKLCVSNIKLTLEPNCIRHPEGRVSKRLSSSTEFRASIHSGSMSPSHTTHDHTSDKSS